jgi:hypothetical protein
MGEQPSAEHKWLYRLVGEWTMESECDMGPDEPATKSVGKETVRSLGGLWTIGEGTVESGECPGTSVMTLGYDLRTKCFVGTFIASMMSHLWPYHGTLDDSGKVLTLDSEGPSFSGDGSMARYQDVIEFVDDNHRILSSRVRETNGEWRQFMTAHYRRTSVASGRH